MSWSECHFPFAMCHELFTDWDWKRQCEFLQQCGYQGIEVAPFMLGDDLSLVSHETLQQMRTVAESFNLDVIGLHWLLAKTTGLHLTSPDQEVRDRTSGYLKLLAQVCSHLGGSVMVFGSPDQRNLQPDMSYETGLEYATEIFQNACPTFEELGVTLCMEPLTSKETNFINTCAEACELIDRVDHPHFQLHQDVKAMLGAETESIPVLIKKYAKVTKHFHVNDTNLLGPGMGETDFEPIYQALYDVDYAGWVSVEVFDYSPGCETIARESIKYSRNILSKLQTDG